MEPYNFQQADFLQIPKLDKKSTLRELLVSRCEDYGEKVFLVDPEKNKQYSYMEFFKKVNAVSNLLFKLGVRKDDKVSLLMSNSRNIFLLFRDHAVRAVAAR